MVYYYWVKNMSEKSIDKVQRIISELENEQNELWLRAKIVMQYIELRKKKRLTLEQVAKRMGTSLQLIARFESCNNSPTLSFLVKYANVLDEDITFILGDERLMEIANEK